MTAKAIERLRKLCLALPEISERVSHGEPSWFYKGKKLVITLSDHHHDDRVGFWCAAKLGAQETLVAADPERYYRPPYVGHKGWLGVYLDVPVDWPQVEELIVEAHSTVAAPKRSARSLP